MLIKIKDVSQHYVNGSDCVVALDGLSTEIREGSFLGIMGASGSGKSTLLNTLGGLAAPSEGKILIDGIDIYRLSAERQADFRREYIGFVFQSHNLMPYLTAQENVMLPLVVTGLTAKQKRSMAAEMLERVGLGHRLLHLPSQLSGGEQERVAIARALVNQPPVLLADEPTGSLDTATSRQIMELLAEFHREGQTIVMVSHNPDNRIWFDRILTLSDGAIVADSAVGDQVANF